MINGILLNSRPVLLVPAAPYPSRATSLLRPRNRVYNEDPYSHPPTASNTAFLGQNCADRALFK